jgi:hypothetical protein
VSARALSAFFTEVAPRLLADVRASGALAGADPAAADREWLAVSLHACVRGVVSGPLADAARADLVDAFHDDVLATTPAPREFLASRYAEYDGLARTLGQRAGADVPRAIAEACARHMGVAETRALAETLAPLLEALAEGALEASCEESVRTPPVEGLHALTARLDRAGIPWAVGGSALLAGLGLVREVNDWDVQVDADPEPLRALFADVPHSFHGHGGCHADWKLAFERERVELIPRFAFFVPGGVVRIPFRRSGQWRGLPLASAEAWACAYGLMGEYDEPALRERRAERARRLFACLAEHGADAGVVAELEREPLPPALRDALRRLAAR